MRLVLPPSLGRLKADARAEVLAKELARFEGSLTVDVVRDYAELGRVLLAREAELGWAPPALCARVFPAAHAVLKAVRLGRSAYGAALLCRSDRPLRIESLQGRRVAWVDPLSSGGHLLPVACLREAGIDPATTFVEQRFAGSYRDALLALVSGEVDVASVYTVSAVDASVVRVLESLIGGLAPRLRAFAFTKQAPGDGLVLSRGLDVDVARDLAVRLVTSPPPLLLEAFDAEALTPARAEDYDVLRAALQI